MKLRFTIRDLLWLAALVAVSVGWWFDHKPQRYRIVEHDMMTLGVVQDLVDNQTDERRSLGRPYKIGPDGVRVWQDSEYYKPLTKLNEQEH